MSFTSPETFAGLQSPPAPPLGAGADVIADGRYLHREEATECWALGALLFVMLTGELPFTLPTEGMRHVAQIGERLRNARHCFEAASLHDCWRL